MDTLQAGQTSAAETFDSVNPATAEVIATFPVFGQAEVNAAVERAREAAAWWAGLGWKERQVPPAGLEVAPDPVHRAPRRTRAHRDRQAAGRRQAGDRPGDRAHRLGGQERPPGARPAPGAQRADRAQPGLLVEYAAARRDRRDRPVELPGVHPDGLARLRARVRQRRGVQAERVHPRRRRLAGQLVRRGRAGEAGAATDHRGGHDRRGARAERRQQDRVHRVEPDGPQGDGRVRAEPDAA